MQGRIKGSESRHFGHTYPFTLISHLGHLAAEDLSRIVPIGMFGAILLVVRQHANEQLAMRQQMRISR